MDKNRNNAEQKYVLDERKQKILLAIIQDYALTAEPVGSRTIARKYNLGVSSATIRNEMQDLEDEGYLAQPHTSAGRIPSIKGYRFYVDQLMKPMPVSNKEKSLIVDTIQTHSTRIDEVFRQITKVVASLTHSLLVTTADSHRRVKLNYVRFLPLDEKRVILLAVTDEGAVTNAVVPIPENITIEELQFLADKLNYFLHGKEIDKLDKNLLLTFQKAVQYDISSFSNIFTELNKVLVPKQNVYSGGIAELIEQPEFQNVERMQDILSLLEERDTLRKILSQNMEEPIAIHIGAGNLSKSLSDISIVRAQFFADNDVIGSIAVMGPTRMQYGKIIGVIYFLQHQLNELLKNRSGNNE